jgi:hypothetical protein
MQRRGERDLWAKFGVPLPPSLLALVQGIDGRRSIREIAESVARSGQGDGAEFETLARKLFEALWRCDFVAMGLREDAAG